MKQVIKRVKKWATSLREYFSQPLASQKKSLLVLLILLAILPVTVIATQFVNTETRSHAAICVDESCHQTCLPSQVNKYECRCNGNKEIDCGFACDDAASWPKVAACSSNQICYGSSPVYSSKPFAATVLARFCNAPPPTAAPKPTATPTPPGTVCPNYELQGIARCGDYKNHKGFCAWDDISANKDQYGNLQCPSGTSEIGENGGDCVGATSAKCCIRNDCKASLDSGIDICHDYEARGISRCGNFQKQNGYCVWNSNSCPNGTQQIPEDTGNCVGLPWVGAYCCLPLACIQGLNATPPPTQPPTPTPAHLPDETSCYQLKGLGCATDDEVSNNAGCAGISDSGTTNVLAKNSTNSKICNSYYPNCVTCDIPPTNNGTGPGTGTGTPDNGAGGTGTPDNGAGATATPTLTPTPYPIGTVQMNLVVGLDGIGMGTGNNTPARPKRKVTVEIYKPDVVNPGSAGTSYIYTANGFITFTTIGTNAGYFVTAATDMPTFTNFQTGPYIILVKVDGYLFQSIRQSIPDPNDSTQTITTNVTVVTLGVNTLGTSATTPFTLLPGDVATDGGGRNHLNMFDYFAIVGCQNKNTTDSPSFECPTPANADLN
ncbi:MAG: hypothetical protein ACREGI_03450, partial [Candidatus Levyibacteriota bacterium]